MLTIGSVLAIAFGAAIALSTPIQLASMNHLGQPIPCGDALRADNAPARAADDHNQGLHNRNPNRFIATNYEAQCAALIADKRRHAMIVSTAAATLLLTIGGATLAARRIQSRGTADQRSTHPDHPDPELSE
ncbi:hypothetical protein ACAG24_027860 [Mycobacterium sp. pW049]|uniref:hypothetical protein n=1 Tax=[Mycobacterium] bulgaricum TaxID=3238985 RepID=UPI00351AB33D